MRLISKSKIETKNTEEDSEIKISLLCVASEMNLTFDTNLLSWIIFISISLIGFGVYWIGKQYEQPALFFSLTSHLSAESPSKKRNFYFLATQLFCISFLCFAAAFLNLSLKQIFSEKNSPLSALPILNEGIAIYLILDQSGSMKEKVIIESETAASSKFELLQTVTEKFIKGDPSNGLPGRSEDLIGVLSFARKAEIKAPLTLEHQTVLNAIRDLRPILDREEDGTAIGYAIFKASQLIAATRHYAESQHSSYQIKNAIMILVTDGFQDPNPNDQGNELRMMDPIQAAQQAKNQGIRLYVINVEPKLASEEFGPQRRQLERAAETTGGRLFLVNNSKSLAGIYREIDQLEKSTLPNLEAIKEKRTVKTYPLYPFLIGLALLALGGGFLTETLWLQRVP